MRQQLGELGAALAVFGELEFRSEQLRIRIDERRAIALQQIGGRQRAVEFGELRLVVEQLEVARRAGHEQEDDVLGLGRKCGCFGASGFSDAFSTDCSAVDASPSRRGRRRTAAGTSAARSACGFMFMAYSFVMVSSRFSSTRDTAVQAASCAGVAPFGSAGGCAGFAAARSHGFSLPPAKRCVSFVQQRQQLRTLRSRSASRDSSAGTHR